MPFQSEFIPLELDQLHREAAIRKIEGWRFIQTHAAHTDEGIDLYYSFMKDGKIENLRIKGVQPDQQVPSITDLFLAAFVFENEARELFGVDMRDIAIDFAGALYAPAVSEPMTIISPEQKALRDKARKAAAAKAAKADAPAADAPAKGGFVMTPERKARLDAKLATMSPEKVAKVQAALKAREAEAAGAAAAAPAAAAKPASEEPKPQTAQAPEPATDKDAALEAKLAAMDPEKAAKVRAALAGKAGITAEAPKAEDAPSQTAEAAETVADAQVESLLSLMDADKASKVREAMRLKGGE